MRYSRQVIDELLDRTDMLALARGYVESLDHRGGRWWGCCPFHSENTASFTLNLETKSYYCFGCQQKGNAIDLVMQLENLSFPQALRKLAEHCGYTLPQQAESKGQQQAHKKREALYGLYACVHKSFRQNLRRPRGAGARSYLEQRGVSSEMAELFGLGYAADDSKALYAWLRRQNYSGELLRESGLFSKYNGEICLFWHRLMFPVFDLQGRVIAFSGRELPSAAAAAANNSKAPKYINSSESLIYRKSESLFGLYQSLRTLRQQRSLILCEGNLDVLAWQQAGIGNVAAPLGTAFTAEQAKLLRRYCDKITLAFDGDEAGRKAVYKAAFLLEQQELSSRVITLPAGRDPADILLQNGVECLQKLARTAQDFFSFLAADMQSRFALNELTGVSAALQFIRPFICQIKPGLRRDLYLAQLAKLFGVQQQVLAAEPSLQYADRRANPNKRNQESRPTAPSGIDSNSNAAKDVPRNLPKRPSRAQASRAVPPYNPNLQAELAEREFWASMLLQADLYPKWQELLAKLPWQSEDALLLKDSLDQAMTEQNFHFETLCAKVSRRVPELGRWLLQRKPEPRQEMQGTTAHNYDGYDMASYRSAILQQKYCGVQQCWLKQRKQRAQEQIARLETQENPQDPLQRELLREIETLDFELRELRQHHATIQKNKTAPPKLRIPFSIC